MGAANIADSHVVADLPRRPARRGPLGVIMLDTAFARPPGDAGNAASWPFPVLIERVPGAHARAVVRGEFAGSAAFIEAAQRLQARGAVAIISTCGFLVREQQALAAAVKVPVETSTLLHYQKLSECISPGRRVAVLTIDATAVDATVRARAGIDDDALIFSLTEDAHFVRAILGGNEALDVDRARDEWVRLAGDVQRRHGDIGQWLFECANMPPYAAAVTAATGVAVFDTLTMGRDLYVRATS